MDNESEVSDTHSLRFEDEDSALGLQQRASAKAIALNDAEQKWIMASKRHPVRIMVAGLSGAGKSTLINRLFELDVEQNGAEEGSGKATTEAVRRFDHKMKNDMEVTIFDTPGFGDDIDKHAIIAQMTVKTEEKLDLLLYCVNMGSPGSRVSGSDGDAIVVLTNVFDPPLWNNAIFVLTCANITCMWANEDQYLHLKETIKEALQEKLRKANVPEDIVSKVPVVTAGYMNPVIEPHEQNDWEEELFGKLYERNPETFTALLKAKMSNKEQFIATVVGAILAGGIAGGGGAGAGAGVGAGVGAVVGALGGPFGVAGGAAVGCAIGGGVVGLIGMVGGGAGTLMWKRNKFKDKLAVMKKEKEIKEKDEKKLL